MPKFVADWRGFIGILMGALGEELKYSWWHGIHPLKRGDWRKGGLRVLIKHY